MQAAHFRCAILLFVVSVFSVSSSGCTLGAKTFSMDSNSRVPFFGFEFMERKPKRPASTYSSIRRSEADRSHIETMLQTGTTKTRSFLKAGEKIPASAKVFSASGDSQKRIDANGQCEQAPTDALIPLPVRQRPKAMASRDAIDGMVDFN